jgi:integrase/recombinase XerC
MTIAQVTPSADLIDAYLTHLRQLDRSTRTIGDWRRILTAADRELPQGLDSASEDELRAWLYRDEWGKSTKATYYTALRSFYKWAVGVAPDTIGLHTDPTARLDRPHPPRGRPRPIADQHLQVVLTRGRNPFRLWALLAAYAGLRAIEIARLDREHVTEHTVTIVAGKGDRPGIVPCHPRVWAAIRDLPPGPVARSKIGRRLSERTISARFGVYVRRELGLPHGVSLHPCRHWAGTEVQRASGDVRVTQEFLRHASVASTMIYTAVSDRHLHDAVMALPAADDDPCAARPDG